MLQNSVYLLFDLAWYTQKVPNALGMRIWVKYEHSAPF
jgi:hypothetical protein